MRMDLPGRFSPITTSLPPGDLETAFENLFRLWSHISSRRRLLAAFQRVGHTSIGPATVFGQ